MASDRAARVARALDKAKVPATVQVAVYALVRREVKRAVEEERGALRAWLDKCVSGSRKDAPDWNRGYAEALKDVAATLLARGRK